MTAQWWPPVGWRGSISIGGPIKATRVGVGLKNCAELKLSLAQPELGFKRIGKVRLAGEKIPNTHYASISFIASICSWHGGISRAIVLFLVVASRQGTSINISIKREYLSSLPELTSINRSVRTEVSNRMANKTTIRRHFVSYKGLTVWPDLS